MTDLVGELIEVVQRLHEAGTTMIVVEQSVNVALTLAERAVFMEKGQVRFSGATADLLDRPDVLRSVFIAGAAGGGGAAPAAVATRQAPPADAPVVLECQGVVKRFGGVRAVDGVDLTLREGQILGLIGEYLGRLYLTANRKPQSIVRTVERNDAAEAAAEAKAPFAARHG